MIRFIANDQWIDADDVDPNMTVLRWLRTIQAQRGTKEGCASGDCGACTVMIGTRRDDGRVDYGTANACITLLGTLHGKHLVTVEGLAPAGELHPAQQAMLDLHGSQCGFCTPGFVMSLACLHQRQTPVGREDVIKAISGNLCRCTGYRPIIDAGLQMAGCTPHLGVLATPPELPASDEGPCPSLDDGTRQGFWPRSLDELAAVHHQAAGNVRYVSGGTDLALEITQHHAQLPKLVGLGDVAELKQVYQTDTELVIGGAVSFDRAARALEPLFPGVGATFERIGGAQIRHLGTLGGNLGTASPIGDTPPILLALDAELELWRPGGERRVRVGEFFTGYRETVLDPGELVRGIRIPLPAANDRLWVHKVSKRYEDDISAVLGAFFFRIYGGQAITVRLAFGGMAATPARAGAAEQALMETTLAETAITAAVEALDFTFTPMSDVRASADYRRDVAGNLLRRACHAVRDERPPGGLLDHVASF